MNTAKEVRLPPDAKKALEMEQVEWSAYLRDLFTYRDGLKSIADMIFSERKNQNATLRRIEERRNQIAKLQNQIDEMERNLSDEGLELAHSYLAKANEYNKRIKIIRKVREARASLTYFLNKRK